MNRGSKLRRYSYLAASLPGVIGLFLPYAWDHSPAGAVLGFFPNPVSIHLLPVFMALVILAWQILRLASVSIPAIAMRPLAWLATIAAFVPQIAIAAVLFSDGTGADSIGELLIFLLVTGISLLATIFSAWIFAGTFRNGVADTGRTGILLYNSPLPVYGYWLTNSLLEDFPGNWQSGTYTIFLAACCYLTMIVLELRDLRRSR